MPSVSDHPHISKAATVATQNHQMGNAPENLLPGAQVTEATKRAKILHENHLCFRPFTEDEIFTGGSTDDFCWSVSHHFSVPQVANENSLFLAASGSLFHVRWEQENVHVCPDSVCVPGLKEEKILDKNGDIIDSESYHKFITYYKKMCQRVSNL